MTTPLADRKCIPCEGGACPLLRYNAEDYLKSMKEWSLADDAKSIFADYVMLDFASAVEFINEVAKVAESEGHHPDLHLTGYRKLRISLTTHAIGGLSDNDFILAAKIDRIDKKLKP